MNSQNVENELTTLIDDKTRQPNITTNQHQFPTDSDEDDASLLKLLDDSLPNRMGAVSETSEEPTQFIIPQHGEQSNIGETLVNGDEGHDFGSSAEGPLSHHVENPSFDNGGEVLLAGDDAKLPTLDENSNRNSAGSSSLMMGAIAEDDEEQEDEPAPHNFPSLRFAKDRAKKALDDAKRRVATARLQKQSELFMSEMHIANGNASLASITSPTAAGNTSPKNIASPPVAGRLDQMMKKNNLDQHLVENILSSSHGQMSVDSEDNYTIFSEGELAEMTKGSFSVKQVAAAGENDHRTASFIQFAIPEEPPATTTMQEPPIVAVHEEPAATIADTNATTAQEDTKELTKHSPADPDVVSPTNSKQNEEKELTDLINDDGTRIPNITNNKFNSDSDGAASATVSNLDDDHPKPLSEEEIGMGAIVLETSVEPTQFMPENDGKGNGDVPDVDSDNLEGAHRHVENNAEGMHSHAVKKKYGEVLLFSDDAKLPTLNENSENLNTAESSLMMGAIAEHEEQEDEPAPHNFPSLRFAKDRAKKALDDAKRRVATARLQKQSELFMSEMHIANGNASLASITSPTAPAPVPGRLEQVMKKNNLDQYLVESTRSNSGRMSVGSDDGYTIFSEGEMAEMAKGSFAVKHVAATEESEHRTASFIQFAIPDAPQAKAMQDPPITSVQKDSPTTIQDDTKDSRNNGLVDADLNSPTSSKPKTWISPKIGAKRIFGSPSTGKRKTWKDLLRGSPVTSRESIKKVHDLEGTKISDEIPTAPIDPHSPKPDQSPASVEEPCQKATSPKSPTPPLSQSNRTEASTVPSTASEASQHDHEQEREQEISPLSTASQEQKQQSAPRVLTTMQIRQASRARHRTGPRPTVSGIQQNKIKHKEQKRGTRVHRGSRRVASKSSEKVGMDTSSRETTERDEGLGAGHVKPRRRRSLDSANIGAFQDNVLVGSPSRSHRRRISSNLGEKDGLKTTSKDIIPGDEDRGSGHTKPLQRRSFDSATIGACQENTILDSPSKSRRKRLSTNPCENVGLEAPSNGKEITRGVDDMGPVRVTPQRRKSFDGATIGAFQDNTILDSPPKSRRRRLPTKAGEKVQRKSSGKDITRGDEDSGLVRATPQRRKSFDGATIGALFQDNTIVDSPSKSRRRRLQAGEKVQRKSSGKDITRGDEDTGPVRVTPQRRKSFDGATIGALFQDNTIVDSPSKSRRRRLPSKTSENVGQETTTGKDITRGDEDTDPVRVTPQRRRSFDGATIGAFQDNTIVDSPSRTHRRTAGPRRPIASHHRRSRQTPGDSETRGNKLSKSPARDRRPDHVTRTSRSRSVDKSNEALIGPSINKSKSKNNRPMRRIRLSRSPVPNQRRHHSGSIPTLPEGVTKEGAPRSATRFGTWGSDRRSSGETAAVKPMRQRGSRGGKLQMPPGRASSSSSPTKESSSLLVDE